MPTPNPNLMIECCRVVLENGQASSGVHRSSGYPAGYASW